jgi:DNA/RNA endonuclease YhcR with UshA esterase domain
MMKNQIKIAFLLIISTILLTGCSKDKGKNNVDNYKVQHKDTADINKDQYRIAEIFEGDKNQMHDLIKGTATFAIMHEGTGTFKVLLLKSDGTEVAVLADVTGDFKGKKQIEIPETTAYILDVRTKGKWSVYRE